MSMETKHGAGQPPPQNGANEGYEHSDADPRGLLQSGAHADRRAGGGVLRDGVAILVFTEGAEVWASPLRRLKMRAYYRRAAPAGGTARRTAWLLRRTGKASEIAMAGRTSTTAWCASLWIAPWI